MYYWAPVYFIYRAASKEIFCNATRQPNEDFITNKKMKLKYWHIKARNALHNNSSLCHIHLKEQV